MAMEITVSEIKPQIHGDKCGTEVIVFCDDPAGRIMLRDGRVQDALALMDFIEKHMNNSKLGLDALQVIDQVEGMKSYNPKNK